MPKRQNADNDNVEKVNKRSKVEHKNGETANAEAEISSSTFMLSKDVVNGAVLTDLALNNWRIGGPIGKGSFGEIFLASDNVSTSVTSDNAKYVVKIEPHSNGPLFVEIHCLLKTGKPQDDAQEDTLPRGMPPYIASGSHTFSDTRYRFLILPRYTCDLSTLMCNERLTQKTLLTVAVQIIDILQHIHDRGYAHSDIKSENLMVGTYTNTKKTHLRASERMPSIKSNALMSQSVIYADSSDGNDSDCMYVTPRTSTRRPNIEFSGSNPVRSCRMQRGESNSIYQDMVNTHYLRPTKAVSYCMSDDEEEEEEAKEKEKTTGRRRLRFSNVKPTSIKSSQSQKSRLDIDVEDEVKKECIYLIDFGLASKFVDSQGVHHPFCMDQRRAHDGTLEFTSRDAHLGAHSRRSDLECLGFNLILWSEGSLPWKNVGLQNQPNQVHRMKEIFMMNPRRMLTSLYGNSVPKYLGEYMHYVNELTYSERPDYEHCKRMFVDAFLKLGYRKKQMHFSLAEARRESAKLAYKLAHSESKESNGVSKDVKVPIKSILSLLTPYKENGECIAGTPNSISPKNLRSKVDKMSAKRNKKGENDVPDLFDENINPDEVARKRAEVEFDREAKDETPEVCHRFTGYPTYAILNIQNRLNMKEKVDSKDENGEEPLWIKGYTPSMMDVVRKKKLLENNHHDESYCVTQSDVEEESEDDEDEENEKSEDDDAGYDDYENDVTVEGDDQDEEEDEKNDVTMETESDDNEDDNDDDEDKEEDENGQDEDEDDEQQENTETERDGGANMIVRSCASPLRQKLGLRTMIKATCKSIDYRDHLMLKSQRKARRGNTSANDESSGSSSSQSSSSTIRLHKQQQNKTHKLIDTDVSESSRSSSTSDVFRPVCRRGRGRPPKKRFPVAKNGGGHQHGNEAAAAHPNKSTSMKRMKRRHKREGRQQQRHKVSYLQNGRLLISTRG